MELSGHCLCGAVGFRLSGWASPVQACHAERCRRATGADYALSVTGIAGPGGGSREKPVGTTWIGLAGPGGSRARRYRFTGSRPRNRELAVAAALDTLCRALDDGISGF